MTRNMFTMLKESGVALCTFGSQNKEKCFKDKWVYYDFDLMVLFCS